MAIELIAVDVDGTLLNSAKQLSAATAAALHGAREARGVKVVLASARPPRSLMGFYEQLRLETPMINYNGAMVYNPADQAVLLHKPLSAEVAAALVALARRLGPELLVSAEVTDKWYTDRLDPRYLTETARQFAPDVLAPVETWLNQPITKLMLLGAPATLRRVAEAIERQFPHQVSTVVTESDLLQLMHPTAGKAQALRVVAGQLCVPRERVMAIGDNANDVGMIQWAGLGVAMGNAPAQVKQAADFVTDSHDCDGVAAVIRRRVLQVSEA
jgi:hypothetical protein